MTDIFNNENYRYLRGGRVLMVCIRCGVTVADVTLHDEWHDSISGTEVLLGELVVDEPEPQQPEPEQHEAIEEKK